MQLDHNLDHLTSPVQTNLS